MNGSLIQSTQSFPQMTGSTQDSANSPQQQSPQIIKFQPTGELPADTPLYLNPKAWLNVMTPQEYNEMRGLKDQDQMRRFYESVWIKKSPRAKFLYDPDHTTQQFNELTQPLIETQSIFTRMLLVLPACYFLRVRNVMPFRAKMLLSVSFFIGMATIKLKQDLTMRRTAEKLGLLHKFNFNEF